MPLKKLPPTEGITTDQLIAQIEQKDRIFRIAQTIFMISTFVALIVVISAQQRTLTGVRDQLHQAKQVAAEQSKQSDASDAKIIRRLDCMTVFFSQKDRTNLSIANIDECTLDRDGNLQKFFTTDPQGNTTTTPTQQGQETPKAAAP